MPERRKHRRIPFARAVTVTDSGGETCLLEAEDLSLAGIRLYSDRPVRVGEVLKLRFFVVPRGEAHALNMQGRVRHVEAAHDGYSLGVGFLDPA